MVTSEFPSREGFGDQVAHRRKQGHQAPVRVGSRAHNAFPRVRNLPKNSRRKYEEAVL